MQSSIDFCIHVLAAPGKQDAQAIHDYLTKSMTERIMVIDGAMGTTIQQYKFNEFDFREGHFEDHPETQELKGNNDLLCFTRVRTPPQSPTSRRVESNPPPEAWMLVD